MFIGRISGATLGGAAGLLDLFEIGLRLAEPRVQLDRLLPLPDGIVDPTQPDEGEPEVVVGVGVAGAVA